MNGSDKCEQLASSEPSKQQLCAGNNQNAGWLMYPEKKKSRRVVPENLLSTSGITSLCFFPATETESESAHKTNDRFSVWWQHQRGDQVATCNSLLVYQYAAFFGGDGHKVVVAVGFFSVAESEVTFAVICSTAESDLTFQSDVDASVD